MAQETDSGWQVEYDDRFEHRLINDHGDTISLKRSPVRDVDNVEVIGRIDGQIYHTTHAREAEGYERMRVLRNLAEREVVFEEADDVFVVSDGFTPVVQQGVVVENREQYRSVEVHFDSDPFDPKSHDHRTIACDPSEILHADADATEVLDFIGRSDLIEPEDFDG